MQCQYLEDLPVGPLPQLSQHVELFSPVLPAFVRHLSADLQGLSVSGTAEALCWSAEGQVAAVASWAEQS